MAKVKLGMWGIVTILLIWLLINTSRESVIDLTATAMPPSVEVQPVVLAVSLPTMPPKRMLSPTTASLLPTKIAVISPSPEKHPICPKMSSKQYRGGLAYQFDRDDPVRPAAQHADKNLSLRSYALIMGPVAGNNLVYYGRDDPTQPPQLATLFQPARLPDFTAYYQVHHWSWSEAPNPGQRANLITIPPVTALGLSTIPGESLHAPVSGYDIGGGMAALVIYADEDTVALRYTREDSSGSRGYTIHLDQICTNPNLLLLYQKLDNSVGPRYQFVSDGERPYQYNLPELAPGQLLGTAQGYEIVVTVVDSGSFMDPRSCDEWWQIRPAGIACPAQQGDR